MSQKILAPIDLSQDSAIALTMPYAVEMAETRGATLELLTVLPDFKAEMYPYMEVDSTEASVKSVEQDLQKVGQNHVPSNVTWNMAVEVGRMPRTLVAHINDTRPDMVVMAAHEPGLADYFLGSVSDYVVRHAHCPVLVVRDPNNAG